MALWYKGKNHSADLVLIAGAGEQRSIALIERGGPPFKGCYALPGGFVDTSVNPGERYVLDIETPEQAALRELKEEASADLSLIEGLVVQHVGHYDDPNRDPRNTFDAQVVSDAYLVQIPEQIPLKAEDDAARAEWIPLAEILSGKKRLAFDHSKIVGDALIMAGIVPASEPAPDNFVSSPSP